MNQRQIGIIILVIGIALVSLVFLLKTQADRQIASLAHATGTCYTPEGECLHQRQATSHILAWVLSSSLVILGSYLLFFDKTYALLISEQRRFADEVREAKRKDEFSAYLAGFSPEEQLVLKAVKEQDGIQQSTLRYRTGIAKASLSLLLTSLEGRGVIARKASGKTKEVYLRKKF